MQAQQRARVAAMATAMALVRGECDLEVTRAPERSPTALKLNTEKLLIIRFRKLLASPVRVVSVKSAQATDDTELCCRVRIAKQGLVIFISYCQDINN